MDWSESEAFCNLLFISKLGNFQDLVGKFSDIWWNRGIQAIPSNPSDLEEFLIHPDVAGPEYRAFLDALHSIHDLATPIGQEHLLQQAAFCGSPYATAHDLPPEALALSLWIHDRVTFDRALDMFRFQTAENWRTFKGVGRCFISNISAVIPAFEERLVQSFKRLNGSDKVLVRHYEDGKAHNFIICHESRPQSGARLGLDKANVTITPFAYRAARQDFLSYYPRSGKLLMKAPVASERDVIRHAFAEVCLGAPEFFEAVSRPAVDLSPLSDPSFRLSTDEGDFARLAELAFCPPQDLNPTLQIKSTDVFQTLEAFGLRKFLPFATLHAAKIRMHLAGERRAFAVTLNTPDRISFSRPRHSARIMDYLERWKLVEEC